MVRGVVSPHEQVIGFFREGQDSDRAPDHVEKKVEHRAKLNRVRRDPEDATYILLGCAETRYLDPADGLDLFWRWKRGDHRLRFERLVETRRLGISDSGVT